MLLKQVFKTLHGAQKRCTFERAHARGNYRFFIVRCIKGKPDGETFTSSQKYDYRLEKTISDHPSDPRTLL
jgi:hypothetical protein